MEDLVEVGVFEGSDMDLLKRNRVKKEVDAIYQGMIADVIAAGDVNLADVPDWVKAESLWFDLLLKYARRRAEVVKMRLNHGWGREAFNERGDEEKNIIERIAELKPND